jgi:leucyl aminopeptidase
MLMKIAFAKLEQPNSGAIVAGVFEDRKLTPTAAALDRQTDGAVTRALAGSRFKGKPDNLLALIAPAGLELSRIVLVGLGKPDTIDALALQATGGRIVAHLNSVGESKAAVAIDEVPGATLSPAEQAAHLAFGARLRSYRFDKYRTTEKPEAKPTLKKLTVMLDDQAGAKRAYGALEKIGDAVVWTRDLVSEPANILYPETLAEEARKLAEVGVDVEVLGEKQMRKLGMGALLGVGQGSARESRLVVMRWTGAADEKQPPVAFVGKGVTFDTGGISIKPAGGMEDMKWDMAGAGTVIGLMAALAGRRAKVDAVGLVGLVENMPSGTAQRPGDVVTTYSGQTVEVINTDAEGRLVLADVLWYCQQKFDPRFMIDLATLTGAIIVALGHEYAGFFSNDDELATQLHAAGTASGEKVWRMPLDDAYDKLLRSEIADMKNIGGRPAGSISAAQFVQRFVNGKPWAHLDIAGMAWSSKDAPTTPKGATAFGVRLLDRLVAEHYEG